MMKQRNNKIKVGDEHDSLLNNNNNSNNNNSSGGNDNSDGVNYNGDTYNSSKKRNSINYVDQKEYLKWKEIYNQKQSANQLKENKYDLRLLKKLVYIIGLIFDSAFPIVIIVVLLGLATSQTWVSKFTGEFLASVYSALTLGDKSMFVKSIFKGLGILSLSAILDALIKLATSILAWHWRSVLVLKTQSNYFKDSLFYRLIQLDDRVDNPDQRITDDIDQFTTLLSTILAQLVSAPLVIVYYTYLCWTLIGWYAPAIVIGYFLFGYIISKLIMSPLVSLSFLQDRLEGDFRYLHLRIRQFAEPIALQNTSRDNHIEDVMVEESQTKTQFRVLQNNKLKVIGWTFGLNSTSDLFSYLAPLVNYCIIAIPIFFGWNTIITAANVTEFSYNCIMLANGFTQYINVATNISQMSSYILRISTMLEVCNMLKSTDKISSNSKSKQHQQQQDKQQYQQPDQSSVKSPQIQLNVNNGDITNQDNLIINQDNQQLVINDQIEEINLKDLTFFTPKGKSLYYNISVSIEKGINLLIMGASGSGKSSLIRVINGLWPFYYGKISRPSNESLYYLSQQPYLIFGTLEEQIIYPYTKATHSINKFEMAQLFERLDMGYLLEREESIRLNGDLNDLTHNWMNQLSPGEQQLLSIIRMFYHCPTFALMDESTSSIPVSMEDRVYEQCKQLGITVISIGHRESLIKHHQKVINFTEQQQQQNHGQPHHQQQ